MTRSFFLVLYRYLVPLGALATTACFTCDDCEGNLAPLKCRVVPPLSPASAILPAGASIDLTTSIPQGCSPPFIRNMEPDVVRLDVAFPTIHATTLRNGTAHITLLAAADTTLQTQGVYTVANPQPDR